MNIGIVGMGLIGGSLALELRDLGHTVWGTSRSSQTCTTALERHIVDRASTQLESLHEVDIVFICTPIPYVLPTLRALAGILPSQAIATDVASVKATIAQPATELWPNFVAAHPMAGTAEQGIDAAQRGLFTGCSYVITPVETTRPAAISTLETVLRPLEVNLVRASPATHDAAVAWISHLPAMVSAALITAVASAGDSERTLAQQLASSGFRDTSRVGGGNPELGTAMAEFNRNALLRSLYAYRTALDETISAIEDKQWPQLFETLQPNGQLRAPFVD
ncbi:MAG: prephenate/arogenate dehydrogenase [Cyanobacteria bacterium P01_G01_bin.4]